MARTFCRGLCVGSLILVARVAPLGSQEQTQPQLALTIALRPGPPVGQTPEEAVAAGVPATTVFDQGAPIDVAFTIANHGPGEYTYFDRNGDRSGRMDEFAVEVLGEQGQQLPDPRRLWGGGWMGGGLGGVAKLAPGASFAKHIPLNQWVMPLAAGRYFVTGVFRPDYPRQSSLPSVRSIAVAVEIRPRSEADMRAYVASLAAELKSDQPERRVQALRCLGFTGRPDALPYLAAGFYDDAPNAPFQAGQGFLYLSDRQACVAALLASLRERGPADELTYLLMHYQVPPTGTLADTVKGLSSPDPNRRAAAAAALARHAALGEAALIPLLGALHDPDARVRERAAGALLAFGEAKGLPPLLEATHDLDESVRASAACMLGDLKAQAAIPRLRELFGDTQKVADEAVRALEYIGPPAAEALRAGLAAPSQRVRLRCAATLLQFGDDSVRELLAQALETATPERQEFLFNLLGHAVDMRHIPGPGKDGAAYCYDRAAWLEWLRRKP